MRIQVSDPEHVDSLLAFLSRRVDMVVARVGEDEIEASQLGSMNAEARRLELDLLLGVWQSANAGMSARIV
jgi:hypothetical protein